MKRTPEARFLDLVEFIPFHSCWEWLGNKNQFAQIDALTSIGQSDEQIFEKIKKEWRSEIVTLAGKSHCAACLQPVTVKICFECGQTIHNERSLQ